MEKYGYTSEQFAKFNAYAFRALIGFAVMYAFFYNGRMNMGLSLTSMTEELQISKGQAGAITSSLFWCYGFGHLFAGRMGEIFGNKRVMAVGIILSILLNLTISIQTSPSLIALFWGLNGFAQALVFSPGIALSANWWPKTRRGFSSGIITGAAGLAQIFAWLSVLAAFALMPDAGWRAAFRLPMIPMLVFGIFFLIAAKNKPADVGLPDFQEEDAEASALEAERNKIMQEKGKLYPYVTLLRNRKMILFMFIIAIVGIARYGLITWIPMYYVDVLGMDVKSGIFNSIVLPVGMALAYFIMPILSDKYFKSRREPLLIFCGVVSAVLIWLFPYFTSFYSAAFGLLAVGFFSAVHGLIWAFAQDIGTRAFAGTATGLLDWAAYMGAGAQSVLFGALIESTGNWNYVFMTISILFVVMVVLSLASNRIRME